MRHMAAPKHVENRNKRTWKKKCASSWLFTKTKSCCLFLNFQSTCHYCMIPSDCNVCVVWLTSFQILINWTPHLRVKTFSAYDKIGAKMKRNPVLGVVCDEGSYWVLSHTSGYFIWIGNTGEPPLICCPRLLIQYSQLLSKLEAVPPPATWGRAMPRWQGPTVACLNPITWILYAFGTKEG